MADGPVSVVLEPGKGTGKGGALTLMDEPATPAPGAAVVGIPGSKGFGAVVLPAPFAEVCGPE